jgi:cation transport regulator
MPYSKNSELPDSVKVLPAAAQSIFRKAFNSAEKQYDDEERAFKVAWAAVKKAGYKKEDGEWVKESDIEENLSEMYYGITSFDQLEAQRKATEKALEVQELTYAYTSMIENIMAGDEEDKIGEINRLTTEFTSRLTQLQEAEQRRKIEQNEEDMVELEENAKSVVTEIQESENGPLHAVVRIIKPGWGNQRDNHYYPKDVLQRDAYKFVGSKMFETDHKQHEKSTRTWVSTIEDIVGYEEGAPLAKVAVHDEGFANRLRNLNELGILEKMECSIAANGIAKGGFKMGGREGKQVEAISKVSSVDWVTRAGAGGAAVSLLENDGEDVFQEIIADKQLRTKSIEDILEKGEMDEDVRKEFISLIEADQEANEKLLSLIKESNMEEKDKKPVEGEEQEEDSEIEEVDINETESVQFLEVDKVKEILSETALPKYAQTRLAYSGRFSNEEEIKEVAEAELEYIKNVTRSGKPFGLDKNQPEKRDKVNKFAEAEKAKDKLAADFMNNKRK